MVGRVTVLALAISSAVLVVALAQGVGRLLAAVTEGSVEFQDGAGNTRQSFPPGEVAAFYLRDANLSTTTTSTATWTQVTEQVPKLTWWSLATGAPQAAVYALSADSAYDTTTPANTPLRSVSTPKVNGVPQGLNDFNGLTGEFNLQFDVDASSILEVDFIFDVVDLYAASQHRASVTSTSDAAGEWVAIAEVMSETDTGSSPTSGLFRGEVALSGDVAASALGDMAVWVQPGDTLTVTYYDSDGATVIDTHQVTVDSPALTSVPSADWLPLALLAGVFAVAMAWRRRSSGEVAQVE